MAEKEPVKETETKEVKKPVSIKKEIGDIHEEITALRAKLSLASSEIKDGEKESEHSKILKKIQDLRIDMETEFDPAFPAKRAPVSNMDF